MARFNYESLQGDNVLFKQGSQAALNAMLPGGSSAGTAIEGAFYLTTDTHRLYIGRKVNTVPNPNPYSVSIGQVYPEEISTGIATVATTGDLAQVQVTGEAHDGDFYYIKDTNVLAVFEENTDGTTGGSWQQINSPTGIDRFTANISSTVPSSTPTFNNSNTYVRIRESLKPAGVATTTDSDFWLKAGDNITLKPSAENNAIEISSANSQSTLTLADSNATANKAKAILSDGINFDSNLYFVGASDTTATAENTYKASTDTSVVANKAYYTRSGASEPYTYTLVTSPTGNPATSNYYEKESTVTITGPGVKGAIVTELGTAGATTGTSGFKIGVKVQNGANSTTTTTYEDSTPGVPNSYINPKIQVGDSNTTEICFRGGRADLPVYTISETNSAISNAVTTALQGVDALHYKGTVASSSTLGSLDNGTLQTGDVYKASADFSYQSGANIVYVKTGDLLIAQGTEYALSSDTSVNSSKTYYTRTGNNITDYVYTPVANPTGNPHTLNYYEYTGLISSGTVTWELVPSGDEPVLRGRIVNTATDGAGPQFGLEDKNLPDYNAGASAAARLAKRPLNVQFDNANSTLIKAASTGDTADLMKITLHHQVPASGNVTTVTSSNVTANSGTDTLITKDQVASFVALSSITRDSFGHVTDVAGQTITLKHNYLTAFNATHSAGTTLTGGTYGQVLVGANDTFGFSNNATKATVKIVSDSLTITAPNTNDELNVNLVWQSF